MEAGEVREEVGEPDVLTEEGEEGEGGWETEEVGEEEGREEGGEVGV